MPVWGERYTTEAFKEAGKIVLPLQNLDAQLIVIGRITSLVSYLESIQAE